MAKNKSIVKILGIGIILFFTLALISSEVWARAGGGRSGGFRGSRSYSAPASRQGPPSIKEVSRPLQEPCPDPNSPLSQSTGSPFLRGLAGGLAGGFLGSLLFGGMGHGAGSGWGSGGSGVSGF